MSRFPPIIHNKREDKRFYNSYGIVMIFILMNHSIGIMYVAGMYIENPLMRTILKRLADFFVRFCKHVVPVAWILTHGKIRNFVLKKAKNLIN